MEPKYKVGDIVDHKICIIRLIITGIYGEDSTYDYRVRDYDMREHDVVEEELEPYKESI